MDDALKQRLIGAILVVGTAVIVLVSLLGGHARKKSAPQSSARPTRVAHDKAPVNTTPKLKAQETSPQPMTQLQGARPGRQQPSGTGSAPQPAANKPKQARKAPHPQAMAPGKPATAPAQGTQPQPSAPSVSEKPSHPKTQTPSAPARARHKPTATRAPPDHAQAPSSATVHAPQNHSGWVVQVASFRDRRKAEAMQSHLSGQGFHAFVAKGTVSGHPVYRVRVGPVANKTARDELVQRLRTRLGHDVLPLRQ